MSKSRSRSRSQSTRKGKTTTAARKRPQKANSSKSEDDNNNNTKAESSESSTSIENPTAGSDNDDEDDDDDRPVRVTELPEPNTSPRDPNHYRIIRLENGFRAILVSTLGYAEEQAKKNLKGRVKKDCEESTHADSVFNRPRASNDNEKNKSVDEGQKARRHRKQMSKTRCFDKSVEYFDRDMNESSAGSMSGTQQSILESLIGPYPMEESMDIDEGFVDAKSPVKEDSDDDSDDDDVFKPKTTSPSTTPAGPDTEKTPTEAENSTPTKKIEIKTKWGPEPETDDKDLLNEERIIMQTKSVEVDIAFTFRGGSINDDIKGLSHLAREAIIAALKEKHIHTYDQQFNPAEYTSIRVTTKVENMKQHCRRIADHIERIRTDRKHVLGYIDELDKSQEAIQCMRCWEDPMIDERRLAILTKFAKEGHPVKTISTGHPPALWTAADAGKKKSELEGRIFQYIEQYCVGPLTTLAIKGPESLDNLQDALSSSFSKLARSENPENNKVDKDPFDTAEFKMFYKVLCSNPHCSDMGDAFLIISWGLPPEYWQNYKTKPLEYIGALISEKGVGGLGHYLRDKNLAWDLNAGCPTASNGVHRNKYCSIFEIQTTLNEDGFQSVNEVVKIIFAYLKFLKQNGPSREFFQEQKKIRSAQFHALGQEIDFDDPYPTSVSNLSMSLQMYETRDMLTAPAILTKYDEGVIQSCMDLLVPHTANYMLCLCDEDPANKIIKEGGLQVEETFHTQYGGAALTEDLLKDWANASPLSEFRFPEPNPFIHVDSCRVWLEENPENFHLYQHEPETKYREFYRVWYHQDVREDHFALYYVHIVSPVSYSTPENAVMLQLWYLLLQDMLHPHLSAAATAGINYNLKPTHHGLLFAVFSWNSRTPAVVEIILREISEFESKLNQDSFRKKKKGWLKHLAGLIRDEYFSNYTVAHDLFESIAHVNHWKLIDLYNHLLTIKLKQFMEFTTEFKKRFTVAALLRGNVNKATAAGFATMLEEKLPPNYLLARFHVRQNLFPKHERVLRFKTFSEFSVENYVYNCYQIGYTCLKTRVCADLFVMQLVDFMEEYQKGSHTSKKNKSESGKSRSRKKNSDEEWVPPNHIIVPKLVEEQGIVTIILEAYGAVKHNNVSDLNDLADDLLEHFYEAKLKKICDPEFKKMKTKLGDEKYDGPGDWDGTESYFYDLSGLYNSIEDLTYRFTHNECKLEALDKLKLQDIHDFYEKYLVPDECEFRKVSIQIRGNEEDEEGTTKKSAPPLSREEWRQRRKNFRQCTFNEHHTLIHGHKTGQKEKFSLHFDAKDKHCDNQHFITDFGLFKKSLFQVPTKVCDT